MKVKVDGVHINYEISGREDGDVVVLSHSLACNLTMWDYQMPALEPHFRVVRYDMRGHGQSDAPARAYTMEELGADAVGLLDALELDKVHWVGLSMGGMIGQYLGINHGDRLKSLVLCDTGAFMPDDAQPIWQERIDEARNQGMAARVPSTLENLFIPEFLEKKPPTIEKISQQLITTPVDGYIGCIEALRKLNYIDRLSEIKTPTLIMVGDKDMGTPVEASRAMQERIAGSKLVIIPDAAHLSTVAQPEAVNKALLDFLKA
ncbi:MAG: 3-oxoadipate enol-lactonase [Deltaproteobacteria bacterium]|nr:3-oxoadipate enol-lactonase [Deltaproteobacteria bacterium]